jgi:quercetin dioxygenase-like cupin family protein
MAEQPAARDPRLTTEPDPQLATVVVDGRLPRVRADVDELTYSDDGRTSQVIFTADNVFVAFNGYKPGMRTRPHIHPAADEVYCVLEGEGHFTHNGELKVLRPGDWLHAAPGEAHGVYNPGPGNLGFIIMVAPRNREHMWVEE